MAIITPIIDRTQEDVDRVKYLTKTILAGTNTQEEWTEFQSDLKGALNYSDLDRIEHNLTELANYFGITLVSMQREVIPRVPYFVNLLTNVRLIRTSLYHRHDTPDTPAMPLSVYQKINDIEKIILDAYDTWVKNQDRYFYCGESVYANDNILLWMLSEL